MPGKRRQNIKEFLSPFLTSGTNTTPTSGAVSSIPSRSTPPAPTTREPVNSTSSTASQPSVTEEKKNKQQRALEAASTFQTLLSIVEKALDGAPGWGPKAVVSAAAEVVKIARLKKENDAMIGELQSEAQNVLDIFSDLPVNRGETSMPEPPGLRRRVESLKSEIGSHLQELDHFQAAHLPSQATTLIEKVKKWLAVTKEALAAEAISQALPDVNRKINDSIRNFLLESQISIEVTTNATYNVALTTDRNVRTLLLNSASVTSNEAAPFAGLHPVKTAFFSAQGAAKTCHEGTRVEVLQQVESWFRQPGSPPILWLSGIAGTGKTTIAQSICEMLEHDLGASFIFSRDDVERRRPSNVLPTIAYQLAAKRPTLRSAISQILSEYPDFAFQSVRFQAQKLLFGAFSSDAMSKIPTTLLLFDALDECDKEDHQECGELIPSLVNFFRTHTCELKVIITSRPEKSIRQMLESRSDQTHLFVLHEVDKGMVQRDIERYLRYELAQIASRNDLDDDWPAVTRESQSRQLAELADRLFIFAATIVKALSKTTHPEEMIKLFLDNTIYSHKSALGTLDKTYLQIVRQVIPQGLDETDESELCEAFQRVIGAIVVLQEPLNFLTLHRLLDVKKTLMRSVITSLYSVLDIDSRSLLSRPIRTFHLSFFDFLTDEKRCVDSRFYIVPKNAHFILAVQCLHIMNKQLKHNICNISDPGLFNTEIEELTEFQERPSLAELRYACSYWWAHLAQVDSTVAIGELVSELGMFASGQILFWIEFLSLMGQLRSAVIGLPQVVSWCRNTSQLAKSENQSQELIETAALLYDADRMIQSFSQPISESALQVYETALTFMPQCKLRTQSSQLESAIIQMISERHDEWSPELRIIDSHEEVVQVTISPNGLLLASRSNASIIRIWDVAFGKQLFVIESNSRHILFSSDSSRLLSLASSYDALDTWDMTSGILLDRLHLRLDDSQLDTENPTCGAISSVGDCVVIGFRSGILCVFRINGIPTPLQGLTQPVLGVAFSQSGLHVSFWSKEAVYVWNVQTLNYMKIPDTKSAISAHVSSDDTRIVAIFWNGSGQPRCRVWDITVGQLLGALDSSLFKACVWMPFGLHDTRIVLGDMMGDIYIYNHTLGHRFSKYNGHTDDISCVTFSLDGVYIVSSSDDRTIRIWDAQLSASMARPFQGQNKNQASCADRAEIKRPYVVRMMREFKLRIIRAFNPRHRDALPSVEPSYASSSTINISPPSRGHEKDIRDMAISRDGSRLVSMDGYSREICCWDTGRLTSKITQRAEKVGFLVNNTPVALHYTRDSETIEVWNAETGEAITTLHGHSAKVRDAQFSTDGTRVVSGSDDTTVRVWDTEKWECTATLQGHRSGVNSVRFSPDGGHVASGSDDKTVRVWDMTASTTLGVWEGHGDYSTATLQGHTSSVDSVCFSPDGSRVASGSYDKTVRVWDVATGTVLAVLEWHNGYSISSLCFSPNGLYIIAENWRGDKQEWKAGDDFPPSASSTVPPSSTFSLDLSGWLSVYAPSTSSLRRLCWLPVERRGPIRSSGFTVAAGSKHGIVTILTVSPMVIELCR